MPPLVNDQRNKVEIIVILEKKESDIMKRSDDIPVTHTYLQDSGEESDTPSTVEVLEYF